jgi:REP element-mobilizing transposase RayT
MSRPLRIEFPGALYHVSSRGNARQPIFIDDVDRRDFLAGLAIACARMDWIVWAWALLDDHYHLLIETRRASLSRGMREVNGVYTQGFNRRHQQSGHLFGGRFKALLVERDAYLLEVARYVVLSPVRAGLAKAPERYAWSSYRAIMGEAESPAWLAASDTLALFGKRRATARAAYARFVQQGLASTFAPERQAQHQLYVGSEAFVEALTRKRRRLPSKEVPRAQRRLRTLASYAREHRDRDAAIRAAYAGGGYTLPEIGAYFGLHYSTVSRIARRGDTRDAANA